MRFIANKNAYEAIPGNVIAYWVSRAIINAFLYGTQLREICSPRVGLQTSDNERFLRLWHEVSYEDSYYEATDCINGFASGKKWFPHNKGGSYRKWYGNLDYVINYQNNGHLLSVTAGAAVIPDRLVFRKAITYSRLCGGAISFREQPQGCTFDSASVNAFVEENQQKYVLAVLNTKIINRIVKIISPTINTQPGDIAKVPIVFDDERKNQIDILSSDNISLAKTDWDSFENSWNFKRHPLI